MVTQPIVAAPPRRSFTAVTTYVFERVMPDAFVLGDRADGAGGGRGAGLRPARHAAGDPVLLVRRMFNILGFAFQMILILVTGHVLAHAPPVQRGLRALVSHVRTPNQGVALTFLVAACASLVNWGFGLVIGAVLAREVARQVRLDFAWLVAAGVFGLGGLGQRPVRFHPDLPGLARQRAQHRREADRAHPALRRFHPHHLQRGADAVDRADHAVRIHADPPARRGSAGVHPAAGRARAAAPAALRSAVRAAAGAVARGQPVPGRGRARHSRH